MLFYIVLTLWGGGDSKYKGKYVKHEVGYQHYQHTIVQNRR